MIWYFFTEIHFVMLFGIALSTHNANFDRDVRNLPYLQVFFLIKNE